MCRTEGLFGGKLSNKGIKKTGQLNIHPFHMKNEIPDSNLKDGRPEGCGKKGFAEKCMLLPKWAGKPIFFVKLFLEKN